VHPPTVGVLGTSRCRTSANAHHAANECTRGLPLSSCFLAQTSLDREDPGCYSFFVGNFLNQLPAILGVLIGALGTLLVTSLTDKARWRRDQAVRWDTRRLDAYVAFAATVKESHALAFRITAPYRRYSKSHPIDREQGLALLAEAKVRRTKAWEAVLLLGNEETVTAARAWKDAVDAEERLCGGEFIDEMEWQSAVETVDQARDEFYLSARENLGVHGGSVAQYTFLRYRVRTVPSEFTNAAEPLRRSSDS
jgi:hypothetical protein